METKKFCLTERQMPTQWYNIVPTCPTNRCRRCIPRPKQPVTKEQMSAIFAEELIDRRCRRSVSSTSPKRCRRSTRYGGLRRWCAPRDWKKPRHPGKDLFQERKRIARRIAQAQHRRAAGYYNYKQGIRHLTTETGAGQWGAAIAFAAKHFGLDVQVFMVKVSYEQKPTGG